MMTRWQFDDAQIRFEALVVDAKTNGPQIVMQEDVPAVVILAYHEYRRLLTRTGSLAGLFANSPLAGAEFDLTRDTSLPRAVPEL